MDLKTRRNKEIAMYMTGASVEQIAEEVKISWHTVKYDLQNAGVWQRRRDEDIDLDDFFTMRNVIAYRSQHPVGSTVRDQDGNRYKITSCLANFCRTDKGKTFTWIELARVAWCESRGRNPKTTYLAKGERNERDGQVDKQDNG